MVYLDNFDEIRIIKRFSDSMAAERGEPTETHARFNQVCDEVGLRRNAAKQLIGAMCGGIQGGELNVSLGTFKSRRSAWPSWHSLG